MNKASRQMTASFRRWGSILMIISLLIGNVSMASFADGLEGHWSFGVSLTTKSSKTATPSVLQAERASPSELDKETEVPLSLGEILEQTGEEASVAAEWFQVKLNDTVISDSTDWSVRLPENTEIESDWQVEHRLKVTVNAGEYELGQGDTVTWKLGSIQGLNLPEVTWEELALSGRDVGCACLSYSEESGDIYLTTEFYDEVQLYDVIYITFWYRSSFVSAEQKMEIAFDLPGYKEPVIAVLLPSGNGETTMPEESSTEETATKEIATEATIQEETPPEDTTSVSAGTEGDKGGSGGGSGSDFSTQTAGAAEMTTATEIIEVPTTVWLESLAPEETAAHTPTEEQPKNAAANTTGDDSGEGEPAVTDEIEEEVAIAPTKEPELDITLLEAAHGRGEVQPGEVITYRMIIRNEGTKPMKNIRIRDYLPEYTSFVSVEGGDYGVIEGRQHVTWVLDWLHPGIDKELIVSVKVFTCIPQNHTIENNVYWQVDNKTGINDPEDPSEEKLLPGIKVG
ncbi:MAG: DUF11 domain-containing protein [Lachnospiraceae bacterium]